MEAVSQRLEGLKEILTGDNSREYDVYIKGMIRAYNELREVDVDLPIKEEEADEV